MKKVAVKVLDENGEEALQYSGSRGYLPLRDHIANRMNSKSMTDVNAKDILVTSGSQQALNAFKNYQPKVMEVSTNKEGIIAEELEKILQNNDRVKFIYVIPDFQNLTGITWALER